MLLTEETIVLTTVPVEPEWTRSHNRNAQYRGNLMTVFLSTYAIFTIIIIHATTDADSEP